MTVDKKTGLTEKQLLFCKHYIKHFNATKAAIEAGYSERSARTEASRLLTNENIQPTISKLMKKRMDRVDVDADYVLKELIACWEADPADIIDLEKGCLKPITEWPTAWRRMISGMKIKQLTEGFGEDAIEVGKLIEIANIDKTKYLKLIGDHINVRAFDKRVEVTGKDGEAIQFTETERASKLAGILTQALARGSQPSSN